jgi:outer membrane protein TolC
MLALSRQLKAARRRMAARVHALQGSWRTFVYQAGLATYLDVLNADTQCHQATIADIQAIAVRYQDTVALFAALGGGWWNIERGDLGAGAPKEQ